MSNSDILGVRLGPFKKVLVLFRIGGISTEGDVGRGSTAFFSRLFAASLPWTSYFLRPTVAGCLPARASSLTVPQRMTPATHSSLPTPPPFQLPRHLPPLLPAPQNKAVAGASRA